MDIEQATHEFSINIYVVIYVFYVSIQAQFPLMSLKRYFPTETEFASIITYKILNVLKVSFLQFSYSEIESPDFETKNDPMFF